MKLIESFEIECELREISEYGFSESEKTKRGRYHGSNFWDIPGFGSKKWVIAVKMDINFSELDTTDTSIKELAEACTNFLNKPPPRKKYARRQPKAKYGELELYHAKIIEKDEDKYISALLITNSRKNVFFWGKGKLI